MTCCRQKFCHELIFTKKLSSISRSTYSKPFQVHTIVVLVLVYSRDVNTILTDILKKYQLDSDHPGAQTLREFVDNLQESQISGRKFLISFQGQKCCRWTDKNDFV